MGPLGWPLDPQEPPLIHFSAKALCPLPLRGQCTSPLPRTSCGGEREQCVSPLPRTSWGGQCVSPLPRTPWKVLGIIELTSNVVQSQLTNPRCSSISSSLKGKSTVALSLSTPAKRATAILVTSAKTTPHLCSEVNWLLVPHKTILCRTRNTVPTRCVCFFKDESPRINILQSGEQALGDGIWSYHPVHYTSERIFIHMPRSPGSQPKGTNH